MIRPNQPDYDAFADWLDSGRPGDQEPTGSDDMLAAREGALGIEALNRRFERDILTVAPGRTPLESILTAASAPPPTSGMPTDQFPERLK